MKTRDRILECALMLFNQQGEPNVSTLEIANELGISPGNLYYHFHGKEPLILGLFERFQAELTPLLDPPENAQLAAEDQIFVAAFVRCHGSIKQMEKFFGVSYPTIKNRLNRIGAQLPLAEIDPEPEPDRPQVTSSGELLSQLERGTLSVDEVLRQIRKPEDRK